MTPRPFLFPLLLIAPLLGSTACAPTAAQANRADSDANAAAEAEQAEADAQAMVERALEDGDKARVPNTLKNVRQHGCDALAAAPVGSRWNAYDDGKAVGSSSAVEGEWLAGEQRACAAVWDGNVSEKDGHTFAAINTQLRADLTKYRAIMFETRGKGEKVRAQFPTKGQMEKATTKGDAKFYDYYGQEFPCGNGSERWTSVVLDLETLVQRGWGHKLELDLDDVAQLEQVTTERPLVDFRCELRDFRLVE